MTSHLVLLYFCLLPAVFLIYKFSRALGTYPALVWGCWKEVVCLQIELSVEVKLTKKITQRLSHLTEGLCQLLSLCLASNGTSPAAQHAWDESVSGLGLLVVPATPAWVHQRDGAWDGGNAVTAPGLR